MIHFKCKAQEAKPEQKKTHERIVNHCFTCKIKSRNKLTVVEDDRHQREKQQSKIHFIHKFEKTYEMT